MKDFAISLICIFLLSTVSCKKYQEVPSKNNIEIVDTTFIEFAVQVSVPEPEDASADTLFANRRAVVTYHTMGTYFIDSIEYVSSRFVIKAVGDDRMLIFPDNDIFTKNYKPRRGDFRLPSAAYEEFSTDSIFGNHPEVNDLFFSYIPKDAIFKLTAIYPARLSIKDFFSRFKIYPAHPELLDMYIYKQCAYKKGEIAIMFPGSDSPVKSQVPK